MSWWNMQSSTGGCVTSRIQHAPRHTYSLCYDTGKNGTTFGLSLKWSYGSGQRIRSDLNCGRDEHDGVEID